MKKITIVLLIAFYGLTTNAQSIDTLLCEAPDRDTIEFENLPWFGNNIYLENFLDSIGYPSGEMKNLTADNLNSSGKVEPNAILVT